MVVFFICTSLVWRCCDAHLEKYSCKWESLQSIRFTKLSQRGCPELSGKQVLCVCVWT